MKQVVYGNFVDIFNKEIYAAEVVVINGCIDSVNRVSYPVEGYIMHGFVNSHVHIESSMLVPSRFAELALLHGTVAVVCDPHEIANVMGESGIDFMIEDSKRTPLRFYFGLPSCVPATSFETSGATLNADRVGELIFDERFSFLSEMMNFPGVVYGDKEVLAKLQSAIVAEKPIDGHAPGLVGDELVKYCNAGISTDHECFTIEEALAKIDCGMKILVREGSAAKNFNALIHLMKNYSSKLMFCTDDSHPDDLLCGHINLMVKRAVALGYDIFDVLKVACLNAVQHYKLDVGLLRVGDSADFICVDNLTDFNVLRTFIAGIEVKNTANVVPVSVNHVNNFVPLYVSKDDLHVVPSADRMRVIQVVEGELVTKSVVLKPFVVDGFVESDIADDVLKIVVVNRYSAENKPVVGFVKGFGLKSGALAGSIAHDSHNVIAVGCNDDSIFAAIETVFSHKGGICFVDGDKTEILPLPVAGLMSVESGKQVAAMYEKANLAVKQAGCVLNAPFMTLSFMSLLVIPELKIGDKGLFDVNKFGFTSLFVD